MNSITIEAPCRVHLTLLAMDNPIYKINGGIGFAIDGLNLKVTAKLSNSFSIFDRRPIPSNKIDTIKLTKALENIRTIHKLQTYISITIESGPANHSGFGIGTAITLSITEAYLLLNEIFLPEIEIIGLSRRGGTSGIGIHTYFQGGFIFDTGSSAIKVKHRPSSYSSDSTPPNIASALPMPDWKMGIFLPKNGESLHGEEELAFFERVCPISHGEAAETAYHALLGTLCSVADNNAEKFSQSINNLQKTKWKREEIGRQGTKQVLLIEELQKMCLGAGMSSLGPAIVFICDDFYHTKSLIEKANLKGDIIKVTPNNSGRSITHA